MNYKDTPNVRIALEYAGQEFTDIFMIIEHDITRNIQATTPRILQINSESARHTGFTGQQIIDNNLLFWERAQRFGTAQDAADALSGIEKGKPSHARYIYSPPGNSPRIHLSAIGIPLEKDEAHLLVIGAFKVFGTVSKSFRFSPVATPASKVVRFPHSSPPQEKTKHIDKNFIA